MFYNYFKVALRSILRSKLTAFINIFGLSLAMTCCLLIFLFIKDEVSYDKYHEHSDKIYRVTRNFLSPDGSVNLHLGHIAPPFGPLLKNDFPDMKEVARVLQNNILFTLEENGEIKLSFEESRTYIAEQSIFNIFTIPLINGNPESGLERPFTIMLSEKMAEKYFGTTDIIGKRIRANNQFDLEVTGVFQAFPDQSHWHPDFLISFTTLYEDAIYGRQGLETNYGNNAFATYVLASDEFDAEKIESQFPAFLDKHMGSTAAENNYPMPSTWTTLFIQPLTDIHLHSHLDSEVEANGNINSVYMMGVIGLFIILIAGFNFINLSTARASKRAKEVGLRKVVGAVKQQLVVQYLSESVLIAVASLALALVFTSVSLTWLNEFTGKSLHLTFLNNGPILLTIIAFPIIVGSLAGIYPAFVIAAFKPALILKGQTGVTRGNGSLRKVLVVSQFAISIVLIIATAVTFQQLDYISNRDLGYAKDQVVTFRYFGGEIGEFDPFYNELVKNNAIKDVGRSSIIPTGRLLDSQGSMIEQGDSMVATSVVMKDVRVDHHFFDTYSIPVVSGRNFSKEVKSDDSLAFVINEAAARMIGWSNEEAVGKTMQNGSVKGRIIGVVRDFHFESLHESIIPIVFHLQPLYRRLSVSIAANDMRTGLAHIEKVWKEFLPHRPFEYTFLSERYQQLYQSEQKQSQLFIIFAGLAILIASLGLLGLATFNTLQRVKEISIRKVLGASVPNILKILSKEIVILILIANILAWPVAWYFMNQWLDSFAYRVELNLGTFLLAGCIALMIAILTISVHTAKAAMTNPASTLRNE